MSKAGPDHPEPAPGTPPDQLGTTPIHSRRRILKGAAWVAPTVVTLWSGRASAVGSTYCIVTPGNGGLNNADVPASRCSATDGKWHRRLESVAFGNTTTAGTASDDLYCLTYVTSSGEEATSGDYGSSTGGGDGPPDATHYALSDSCWISFF
ncbi:MAG: hypothetical protein HQL82_01095 [Magnetococcales bacterium]|nr:hypothetical protein [Magnetococcales bacterium]